MCIIKSGEASVTVLVALSPGSKSLIATEPGIYIYYNPALTVVITSFQGRRNNSQLN